jgi:Domain of unknown function (DUF4166)
MTSIYREALGADFERHHPKMQWRYAYVDRFGRGTGTWVRRFHFPRRTRTFDATMIYSKRRDTIVDYVGTHQHLAVDLHCWVDDE